MKFQLKILILLFCSCGGSLSKEQRQKIRENMEAKSIKKISDADVTEAALAYARKIANAIELHHLNDEKSLDSLEKVYDVEILFMRPGDSNLHSIEKQILEAYVTAASSSSVDDNIQKMGNDSLLYTKPMVKERPDGSVEFTQALGLRLHKRPIILSIKK